MTRLTSCNHGSGSNGPARRAHGQRRGIAMIEAVMATIVIGLMLVAALRTVAATSAGRTDTAQRIVAANLAAELMAEIVNLPYVDPDKTTITSERADFSDVDDYHMYSESPPEDRDGTPREHLARWARSVEVTLVRRSDPTVEAGSDRGVKRIVVTVTRNEMPMARMTALRTSAVPR